ncbi:Small membrane A-kinase anchor protein, partial [Takifugu flavidus]
MRTLRSVREAEPRAREPAWFTRRRTQRTAPPRPTRCCWSTPRSSPRRSWCGPCSSGWRWTGATATSPTSNATSP